MIHHISLETRRDDVDDAVAFWRQLGFERVEPPPSLVHRATWLQHGGTQIHLLYADDPVVMPKGHVAVWAKDYDAAMQRLRDAGFEPERQSEHWGSPRSYVRAPGGHRVEVFAFPPDA